MRGLSDSHPGCELWNSAPTWSRCGWVTPASREDGGRQGCSGILQGLGQLLNLATMDHPQSTPCSLAELGL